MKLDKWKLDKLDIHAYYDNETKKKNIHDNRNILANPPPSKKKYKQKAQTKEKQIKELYRPELAYPKGSQIQREIEKKGK